MPCRSKSRTQREQSRQASPYSNRRGQASGRESVLITGEKTMGTRTRPRKNLETTLIRTSKMRPEMNSAIETSAAAIRTLPILVCLARLTSLQFEVGLTAIDSWHSSTLLRLALTPQFRSESCSTRRTCNHGLRFCLLHHRKSFFIGSTLRGERNGQRTCRCSTA